jgi:acyl-CoA synthetase (AMP-forming)/AMP-acid ligase II
VVVVDDGRPVPTVAELRAHIGDRLAPYKHPRRVIPATSLPRTSATGQVQRSAIRKQLGV